MLKIKLKNLYNGYRNFKIYTNINIKNDSITCIINLPKETY